MGSKLKMGAWHPRDNTFAVGKYNSLFIYTEKRHNKDSKDRKGQLKDEDWTK